MLIKNYNPREHKTLNNTDIRNTLTSKDTSNETYKETYENLEYPTQPIDKVFQNMNSKMLNNLIQEQQKAAEKEAQIFLKYNLLTKATYDKTLEQYKHFLFVNNHAYPISLIKDYVTRDQLQDETYIKVQQTEPQHKNTQPTQPKPTQQSQPTQQPQLQTYEISRQAIRNITKYTHEPIPIWSHKAPYNTPLYQKPTPIKWQLNLLEDQADTIVVNGSRQMGKSHTIAERAIEESFIPENDTLVGAFLAKTTNVIRNYILKLTREFPQDTFIHYKSEGYILNTQSNTRIYFRTLADDAQNVLGLTLYNIIIDEAQLVDEDVFENALLPTLTTTGGRLILIGTPGKKQKGYYFQKMIEAKKQQEDPTLHQTSHEKISLYEVTIDENPLVHPRTRQRIEEKKDDPAIQRQYYCNWNANTEELFQYNIIQQIHDIKDPTYLKQGYIVLGIDPARLQDRSGYSIHHIHENKIKTILSGEVPKTHKKSWEMQSVFFKKITERYKSLLYQPNNFLTVIDISGVGDGVAELFKKNGLTINLAVRYTAGQSITESINQSGIIEYKVGKSILINTALDYISEGTHEVYKQANQLLIEESNYIYEVETRTQQISFETTYFDDITNSLLIALFAIQKRNLLARTTHHDPNNTKTIHNETEGWLYGIEYRDKILKLDKKKFRKDNSVW